MSGLKRRHKIGEDAEIYSPGRATKKTGKKPHVPILVVSGGNKR
jgi:hypothetical protein